MEKIEREESIISVEASVTIVQFGDDAPKPYNIIAITNHDTRIPNDNKELQVGDVVKVTIEKMGN